ncbi:CPBP family glutamic-type intramembrane protease [Aurantiacibacter spongiae]|uniref:CPBP family intramembrane metalloprotease n=1 Tax=Aurantiacibacter spongiae TaxID=2488860 RepID=A0A3N5CRA8_9SPHN|nr:CPBP family glutamic-type intramembrane protease [Aurantiacibacter spongiae]RPF71147.1 CPBP family intramembrane metalloprotease [Aurantiacibacter spongiae]
MTPAVSLVLFACWWVVPLLVLAILRVSGQVRIVWRWLALALAVHALYALAGYTSLPTGYADTVAQARWIGRLAQLAAGAAMALLLLANARTRHGWLTPEGLGLTIRQRAGSLTWSLAGILLLALMGWLAGAGAEPATGGGRLYPLLLSGPAEELAFRGLLLSLLAAALGGTVRALGWAAVLTTLLYALTQGIGAEGTAIAIQVREIGYHVLVGTILVLMRLNSGSLLLPVIGNTVLGLAMRLA